MFHWTVEIHRHIPFTRLEARQRELADEVRANPETRYLLISEPSPTYTHGRFAAASDCLWPAETLAERGISVVPVSRGGKWTYHGPGQILVYPIARLEALGLSRRAVHGFLTTLRSSVAAGLCAWGVPAEPRARPFGIYAKGAKLVSFGISVEQGVTQHGLALYHSDQTRAFLGINPCGVAAERVVSLEQLGVQKDWETTANGLTEWIKNGFNRIGHQVT